MRLCAVVLCLFRHVLCLCGHFVEEVAFGLDQISGGDFVRWLSFASGLAARIQLLYALWITAEELIQKVFGVLEVGVDRCLDCCWVAETVLCWDACLGKEFV